MSLFSGKEQRAGTGDDNDTLTGATAPEMAKPVVGVVGPGLELNITNTDGERTTSSKGKIDLALLLRKDGYTIGRLADRDLQIDHNKVSRRHCVLSALQLDGTEPPEYRFFVKDQGSSNGTYVNSERCNGEKIELTDGDTITLVSEVTQEEVSLVFRTPPKLVTVAPGQGESRSISQSVATGHGSIAGFLTLSAEEKVTLLNQMKFLAADTEKITEFSELFDSTLSVLMRKLPKVTSGYVAAYKEGAYRIAAQRGRSSEIAEIRVSATLFQETVDSDDAVIFEVRDQGLQSIIAQADQVMVLPLENSNGWRTSVVLYCKGPGLTLTEDDLEKGVCICEPIRERLTTVRKQTMEMGLKLAEMDEASINPNFPDGVDWCEFAGHFEGLEGPSGDINQFTLLPNGHLLLKVGDVSGHGPSANGVARELRGFSRGVAYESNAEFCLSTHLGQLNNDLSEHGPEGKFAVLAGATIDPDTKILTVADAGHGMFGIYRPSIQELIDVNQILTNDESGLPLGVMPGSEFLPATYQLRSGDIFFWYSDGVTEASGVDASLFGTQGVRETLFSTQPMTASELVTNLNDAVLKHEGGTEKTDDISVGGIQIL